MDALQGSLKRRFLGGIAWTGSGRLLSTLLGLGSTVVLARLLDPGDYGLMGMARVFTGLAQQAQDMGIGQALIRMAKVTPTGQRLAFTYSMAASTLLYGLIFVSAGFVSSFYGEPGVSGVLQVMALMFPLASLFVVPQALLMRGLAMKKIVLIQTVASVVEITVTVLLAFAGHGVWALVLGQLASLAVQAIGFFWAHPWHIGLAFRGEGLGELVHFGGNLTLSRLFWYTYTNADFFIIGRTLGTSALGIYTMAWHLARMPWAKVWMTTVNPLVLPLFIQLQERQAALGPALCKITRYSALVSFPAVVGFWAVADDAVTVLLGAKWEGVIVPLRWLCVLILFRSLGVVLSRLLMATGRIAQEVRYNLVCLVTLIPAFLVGQRYGIEGVAIAWALIYPPILFSMLLPQALRAADLRLGTYLRSFAAPAAAAVAMGLAVYLVGTLLHMAPLLRLPIRVVLGVLIYAAVLRVLQGPFGPEVRALMQDVRHGIKG